jgi:hypothetical protein
MLWDGIVAAHASTCMNWRRTLFRLWLVASGFWMCICAHYIWRTCETFGQELWCRTDYSSALGKFTAWTFLEMAAWVSVVPLTALVLGVVTFQVIDRLLPALKRKD